MTRWGFCENQDKSEFEPQVFYINNNNKNMFPKSIYLKKKKKKRPNSEHSWSQKDQKGEADRLAMRMLPLLLTPTSFLGKWMNSGLSYKVSQMGLHCFAVLRKQQRYQNHVRDLGANLNNKLPLAKLVSSKQCSEGNTFNELKSKYIFI